ncbi:MAG: MFS transporter [Candidatus Ancillula sp.]|jgi:MFS family permease|nr:MFS transporter [Candidatus Ancillula sp.]
MHKYKITRIVISYFLIEFNAAWIIQTLYFQAIGLSFMQIGIIFGFYQAAKIAFDIPTGLLSDRHSKKTITILSIMLTILSLVIAIACKSFIGMIISISIYGIGYVMNTAALSALIVDSVLEDAGNSITKVNSQTRISFYASIASASLIAGYMSDNYSFEIVYIITIGLQIIAIFFTLLIPTVHSTQLENTAENITKVKVLKVVKYINANKKYRFLLLINIIFAIGYIPSDSYYMNILVENGINLDFAGIVLAFQFIVSASIALVILKFLKHRFDELILSFVPIFSVVLLIVFCLVPNIYIATIFYVSQIILMCIFNPISSQHLHLNFNPKYRATALSLQTFVMSIIALAVQPIFGYLASIFSLRTALLPLFTVSLLLLIVNIVNLKKNQST